ncbi:hypothetical protein [Facklamia miroungae]|uniref:Uncharacterized protein n=1 Tax=Facklamia miroungae TaxID=120956 RepID=A0A1G7TX34_9LACT|nr:hypothetical protein [Facklamia miroungae]NKZ30000.1 hypothetical protein [Facklamia miroungae]SDG39574.1 hypothetical protein SAMN05421791_10767 [Facklamia miroungae]
MQNYKIERYLELFRKIYTITFILGLISLLTIIIAKIAYPNPLFTVSSRLGVILFGIGFLFFLMAFALALIQLIKKKRFTNEIEIPLLTGFLIRMLLEFLSLILIIQ